MECMKDHLWWIIPLAVLQIVLMVAALVSICRQKKMPGRKKALWALIAIIFNFIGPLLYFAAGSNSGNKK